MIAPLIANHAMKRLAQSEEIAAAAFFLASDRPARSNRLVSHQSDRHYEAHWPHAITKIQGGSPRGSP